MRSLQLLVMYTACALIEELDTYSGERCLSGGQE